MDIITAIHTRRSIRSFNAKAVTDEELHVLLDAAMAAPSAGNAQPWQFIVVRDKETLAEIPGLNPFAAMAPLGQVGILICGDLKAEKYKGYWPQDCAAATQNLLLAATALGIGTVWTGIYPDESRVEGFKKLFSLPQHIIPMALVVAGRHSQEQNSLSRFKAEKVHFEKW